MAHPASAPEQAPAPAHIPPHLVHDFDIYNPPNAADDYHMSLKVMHRDSMPDIFWTP
ncbi:hypothetical protein [Herbaspirillum sp. B65]|uniref:hypothetical protein n=1 Tax=Herbaspirillum sp. B65 TaxID=137708 RepID=UPI000349836D|nr:hypothetical protein [Herbaspirillum sp. B65]